MDLRSRTTLVCGSLALAMAAASLLRGRTRKGDLLFAAFAADVGLWYLSQSLFGVFQGEVWERLRLILATLLPLFAVNFFEALVPEEGEGGSSKMGRVTALLAIPGVIVTATGYIQSTWVRVLLFLYVLGTLGFGLYELGQRGVQSPSRATQRRVRFLVVAGALAGCFLAADFAWVIGYAPEYSPPPVGVVLSVVFLFILAQALRHQRLLDLYEMLGRLVVATAVAFVIAGIFYLLVTVVGQFNTMWLNAILAAIVVLVLFNPLRDRVEEQIQRIVFRERLRLEVAVGALRRKLVHTVELPDAGNLVMQTLERTRRVTHAGLYLRQPSGAALEALAVLGEPVAARIEAVPLKALWDALEQGPVALEEVQNRLTEGGLSQDEELQHRAILRAADSLGEQLRSAAIVPLRVQDDDENVGILAVADDRIRDAFGPEDIAQFVMIASDMSDLIASSRVYEQMRQKDRLAVLGQMAAGLAHEVRNPLGAIKGAAQLLSDPSDGPGSVSPNQEFVGIILEEVERLNKVVGSVLDLARTAPPKGMPVDARDVIGRTLKMMHAQWTGDGDGDGPTVVTDLGDEPQMVEIAPESLHQVLINLIQNAAQAVDNVGRIEVSLSTRRRAQQSFVTLSILDDGPGMSAAIQSKIFLPFFTTKDRGTGLGLAIGNRMIQEAGGRIEVWSREGEGTRVDVVLPRWDPEPNAEDQV